MNPSEPPASLHFYGHGKLLLSGEYFILDGAKSLALPTKLGQHLRVDFKRSNEEILKWKAIHRDVLWFEAEFDLSSFECKSDSINETILLSEILKEIRNFNPQFLRFEENLEVTVTTDLEFDRNWGLGSSATLIHCLSNWAKINPYELNARFFKSSGYDVACASARQPILYQLIGNAPMRSSCQFNPPFHHQLYFVYLGKKMDTKNAVAHFRQRKNNAACVSEISGLTKEMLEVEDLTSFEKLIEKHEEIVSKNMQLQRAKDLYFNDYWGKVNSLGAWGGDFVLLTNSRSKEELTSYLFQKGFRVCFSFQELILQPS